MPKLRQAYEVIVFFVTFIRIVTQLSSSLTAVSGEERCVTTLRIPLKSPQHSFIIEPAVPSARLFIGLGSKLYPSNMQRMRERQAPLAG